MVKFIHLLESNHSEKINKYTDEQLISVLEELHSMLKQCMFIKHKFYRGTSRVYSEFINKVQIRKDRRPLDTHAIIQKYIDVVSSYEQLPRRSMSVFMSNEYDMASSYGTRVYRCFIPRSANVCFFRWDSNLETGYLYSAFKLFENIYGRKKAFFDVVRSASYSFAKYHVEYKLLNSIYKLLERTDLEQFFTSLASIIYKYKSVIAKECLEYVSAHPNKAVRSNIIASLKDYKLAHASFIEFDLQFICALYVLSTRNNYFNVLDRTPRHSNYEEIIVEDDYYYAIDDSILTVFKEKVEQRAIRGYDSVLKLI